MDASTLFLGAINIMRDVRTKWTLESMEIRRERANEELMARVIRAWGRQAGVSLPSLVSSSDTGFEDPEHEASEVDPEGGESEIDWDFDDHPVSGEMDLDRDVIDGRSFLFALGLDRMVLFGQDAPSLHEFADGLERMNNINRLRFLGRGAVSVDEPTSPISDITMDVD